MGPQASKVIYSIGHSNHSLEKFLGLLKEHSITLLVDVRSAPYSRYNPQFNKGSLERALPQMDIEYAFAGKHLGGRPADPACYKRRSLPDGKVDYLQEVDYPQVMQQPWFLQGIRRLLELADEHRVAVMCSEEDPARCHRHHLIGTYLFTRHPEVEIRHIRGDGAPGTVPQV